MKARLTPNDPFWAPGAQKAPFLHLKWVKNDPILEGPFQEVRGGRGLTSTKLAPAGQIWPKGGVKSGQKGQNDQKVPFPAVDLCTFIYQISFG